MVGYPTSVRGHRTSLATWNNFKIYGVMNNLIVATESIEGNAVFTENAETISAVTVYPQSETTARVAFGTDKGKVNILRLSQDGSLVSDKEH